MIGAPFSHFPILRFIAPEISGYNKFVKIHQELWTFLNKEICNHKKTFVPNAPRDMMDVYLAMLNSDECSDTFSGRKKRTDEMCKKKQKYILSDFIYTC